VFAGSRGIKLFKNLCGMGSRGINPAKSRILNLRDPARDPVPRRPLISTLYLNKK